MNYSEFKTYLSIFLWKENDSVLLANLDALIKMGESSLNREWRTERRHFYTTVSADTLDIALPDDYYAMRSVADTDSKTGEWRYITPPELYAIRDMNDNSSWQPVYSISDKTLLISGPSTATTVPTLTIDYTAKVPAFADLDQSATSWVADDFLDLYTYAVFRHTAPFLREDERVQLWTQLYKDIITLDNETSAHEQVRGISSGMRLPRAAGVRRSGDKPTGLYSR